jgi:type II secretory pathway component PulJ
MPRFSRYFPKIKLLSKGALQKGAQEGFVLLEVLVAMSLILGVWMSMVHIYLSLALRQTQFQTQKAELRKELDVFERSEHARSISSGPIKNESSRVFSRPRALPSASQSIIKNKRRSGG